MKKIYASVFCILLCSCVLTACNHKNPLSGLKNDSGSSDSSFRKLASISPISSCLSGRFSVSETEKNTRIFTDAVEKNIAQNAVASSGYTNGQQIALDPSWEYADHSAIHSGTATIYLATANRKGKIIGVNAGHGTSGGSSVKTFCHPDGSPKTTGGSTAEGAIQAIAVSSGMTFLDGTPEPTVTLRMAQILKEKLLAEGYDVLMVRDGEDVQLDNVARTVLCNHVADCHIALHWDGDGLNYDKGCFYISVPDALKSMEPVASHWQQHDALGEALVTGLRNIGATIYQNGHMNVDLTQTSYSTIPSVDVELGNAASDHSDSTLSQLADGLVQGLNQYSW
nr:N-acetylmuramoyl-L-alanine amidase [uncultured Mediterraneibacter sp.]